MSTRKLNWFESPFDTKNIKSNGWNLQVAKAVASGTGSPTISLVWQSRAMSPITSIQWKVEYALGWTAVVPDQGVQVSISGVWQSCAKGEAYEINTDGFWERSKQPADPKDAGWLNVANVNYRYPGVVGVHIVVGIRNAETGRFDPIFVDKAALGPGSKGRYQPQEMVTWWLAGSDMTGQVYSNTEGPTCEQDYTQPSNPATKAYEYSTTFLTVDNNWAVAPGPPPQSLITPPPSASLTAPVLGGKPPLMLQFDHARWIIAFAKPLALVAAGAALEGYLRNSFKGCTVTVWDKNNNKLRIEYEVGNGAAPGTVAFLGQPLGAAGGPQQTIEEALRAIQSRGDIPADESWFVSPATAPSFITGPSSDEPPSPHDPQDPSGSSITNNFAGLKLQPGFGSNPPVDPQIPSDPRAFSGFPQPQLQGIAAAPSFNNQPWGNGITA
ncbi:hypothetical protein B0T16DRAFT_458876 [Cercophora newfieldiana]|uniref:Uncharacterized protein n=1 Tax=Cercophora newfieldiana TaxID=92897 RepID=A0AA39Y6M4_9PEZI|nr:hypothetical protein B0T16DRAFT_458876 [Cercophora newfieldiana]